MKDWLKRLRKAIYPNKIRYFLVGEYGDSSQRPHYHVALFGYPSCIHGRSMYKVNKNCCRNCDLIRDTWQKGNVDLGTLQRESASYLCGYVTKKMTNKNDSRLNGRIPEFATMSLKPGIGALAMNNVAESLTTDFGCDLIDEIGDVPSTLLQGKKNFPLGRYLKMKLRERLGFEETNTPKEILKDLSFDMCQLHEEDARVAKEKKKSLWLYQKEIREQKIKNLEAKQNIYTKKGSI